MEDFSIDWSNPMAMFYNQQQQMNDGGAEEEEEEEGEVDENDDFYENDNNNNNLLNGQTLAGAIEQKAAQPAVQQTTAQKDTAIMQQKLENQKRAEMLRMKLMAARQATPIKAATPAPAPAPVTASNAAVNTIETPSRAPVTAASKPEQQTKGAAPQPKQEVKVKVKDQPQHIASELDLEALLNAGKAHADAQVAATKQNDATRNAPPVSNTVPRDTQEMDLFPAKLQQQQEQQSSSNSTPPPTKPTNLADVYYTDLAAWLDLTGYHDVEYRESKLRTYKERRALEEEAASIAEKLEKLRQAEETEMRLLRAGTPSVKAPAMRPPPLPQSIVQPVNGLKRGRSPGYAPVEKRQREENGFRIRGAKESPEQRPASSARRPRSPSPGFERRAGYPDARRRSVDERGPPGGPSRDPSLERRAQYYRRDDEPQHDRYTPRGPTRESRLNYGNHGLNGARQGRPNGREMENNYRPSAGMELKKGGQSSYRPR